MHDIRRLCALVFHFFWFCSEFLCPFEPWSNPRFYQDLNKFKHENEKVSMDPSYISHCKMKLLGGLWNFHVWNPESLLFMLDFIRQSLGLLGGRYMICLVWICIDLVYQLGCFLYDIRILAMCFGFSFFWFFWIVIPSWILVKS
jgi:hypothetical protein